MTVDKNRFGAEFRRLRKLSRKSLRDVARTLELSPAYISDVERGRRSMSPLYIRAAALLFDCDPEELLRLDAVERGSFRLDVDFGTSHAKQVLGAHLMSAWDDLSNEDARELTLQVKAIQRVRAILTQGDKASSTAGS